MTQDEIIKMAEQANLDREPPDEYCRVEYWTATFEDLEAYTKLVAAKERDRIANESKDIIKRAEARGATKEREACAKVCEAQNPAGPDYENWWEFAAAIRASAAAIRARGQA